MQPGYLPPPPGYQPPPPPGATREPIRPSAWWFGVAGGVAVVGIALAIFIFVRTFMGWVDRIDGFQRVDVPGQGTVTLTGTGGYTIYHEFPGADDRFFGPDVGEVTLTAPDGSDVPLEDYSSDVTYSSGSHDGVALFSFTAEEPGQYVLSANGDASTLAVGRGIGRGIVAGIVGGIAAGLIGVLAGTVIAIVVGVARGRARRRQMGPPGGMPPPGSYGGSAWTPAPAPGPWTPAPSPSPTPTPTPTPQDRMPPSSPPAPPMPPPPNPWVPPNP